MISINKMNCHTLTITASAISTHTTRVKYTASSGIPDETFDIVGELSASSIDNILNVEEVHIGDTVTSIAKQAFNSCNELKTIILPDSLTSIG